MVLVSGHVSWVHVTLTRYHGFAFSLIGISGRMDCLYLKEMGLSDTAT